MTRYASIVPLILLIMAVSCSRRSRVQPDKILAVYPVFQDCSSSNRGGYKLDNGTVVKYDKGNIYLKEFLKSNLTKADSFSKDPDVQRIVATLENKKTFKPVPLPIKVLPFCEFGYVKTSGGKVIMYGLSRSNAFYDLTNNLITN